VERARLKSLSWRWNQAAPRNLIATVNRFRYPLGRNLPRASILDSCPDVARQLRRGIEAHAAKSYCGPRAPPPSMLARRRVMRSRSRRITPTLVDWDSLSQPTSARSTGNRSSCRSSCKAQPNLPTGEPLREYRRKPLSGVAAVSFGDCFCHDRAAPPEPPAVECQCPGPTP